MRPGCALCGAPELRPSLALPGLDVRRCPECGHRRAWHAAGAAARLDYHEQYAQGAFLDALRATRERQAGLLVAALRRRIPDCDRVLDYGAGQGWFLAACRAAGMARLAGADTSELAVAGLRNAGFEAHRLSAAEGDGGLLPHTLSFAPRVVTFLDVLEHLPPEDLASGLRTIVDACAGGLELVVVKVPVPGVLYQCARALFRLGASGPIRQLYQMGTWPPHLSYFTPRSLETLLAGARLRVVERIGDPDFEPALLPHRANLGRSPLRWPVGLSARALAFAARAFSLCDTVIFLARPKD